MKPRMKMLGLCVVAIAIVISAAWAADETTARASSQPAAVQAQQEQTMPPQQAAPQNQTNAVPPPPPPPPPRAPATATRQSVTPPRAPQHQHEPVASDLTLQYGQWLWDPYAGVWYFQPLIPPPVYYVTPWPYGSLHWWPSPVFPPGKWTYIPNPDYPNTITGMLLLPPQPLPGQFKPGQSPTFPWNQPRTGSGFPPGVGAQAPWLPREPKDKEKPSK